MEAAHRPGVPGQSGLTTAPLVVWMELGSRCAAGENSLSSLKEALIPSITQGRWSYQSAAAARGPQGFLQPPVEPLDQSVSLRMVRCRGRVLDVEQAAQAHPKGRCELGPSV